METTSSTFNAGATFGLEKFCEQLAKVGEWGTVNVLGFMCDVTKNNEWQMGVLYGLSLGADLQVRRRDIDPIFV